ncbi:MAG: triose-phosphate isomerase [Pseudomonadota bacterium]
MPEKIAAGNWKMNGTRADLAQLTAIAQTAQGAQCTTIICPPAPILMAAADHATGIHIGAQDCHAQPQGAHTGDISAAMIRDAGAAYVIVGHSERRTDHGETNAQVLDKCTAARAAGLRPIVCIGETLAEREAGNTLPIVLGQLAQSLPDGDPTGLIVAYEPVWAIGTGKTATPDLIAEMHGALCDALVARYGAAGADIPLLYGGSVKPGNAADIFAVPHVNGALVGGASLRADDFNPIITALSQA